MADSLTTKRIADGQRFAELLGDLSTNLLKASPGTVDSEIRRFVKRIGEYYQVDRVVLRKLTENLTLATALHSWLRNEKVGLVTEFWIDQAPLIASTLYAQEVTRIRNFSDLPPEAKPEREILENSKLRALLVIPIIIDDKLYGAIDLACQAERVWTDEEVHQLGLLADTVIRAHIRARNITSLEANEARYRAVVENQTDLIMRWLPDGKRTWVNDRYCEFCQKPRESLLGTSFLPSLSPLDRQRVVDKVEAMSPEKPAQTDERQLVLPSGETRWQSWTDTGIFSASGKLVEIQSVGRDITEGVISRDAIQKGEDLYRTLFESANDAIFYMDGEVVVDCNKKTLEILHCKREELIGKKPWEFSPPYQHTGMTSKETGKSILKTLESGQPQRFEWVHSQPDGTLLDTEVSLTPVELVQGGSRLLAIARDVTEARRAQRDLTRSQQAAHVGTFSLRYEEPRKEFSMEGNVEMTAEFCKLFGIENRHDSTALVISRIHPDDAVHVIKGIEDAFVSGAEKLETHRVIRPDGSMIYANGWIEVDKDESGNVRRLFGTALDITEQVEANKEIEKLKNQLQDENLYLRKEVRTAHNFGKIIGNSPQLKQALISVEKVAPTDIPVLILGETGTGKDLIARAIYDLSERKDKALITVNCAALSEDLIESEIFGHEKGSFTGAESERKGRFELADGGTLFLDEIGELPGKLQAKLLRVLQTGEFEKLGGTKTLHVDVRLITATNRELKAAVNKGRFRADLYYRISTFPIELPPLRDRPEDIPDLAEFFVQKHAKRMGKEIHSISASLIRQLTRQEWPGNIRELEGFIQRALISTSTRTLDIPDQIETESNALASVDTMIGGESTGLHAAERNHILMVLEKTGWIIDGKRGAAVALEIAPSTLRSKMKRLGIKRTR